LPADARKDDKITGILAQARYFLLFLKIQVILEQVKLTEKESYP